MSCYLSPRIRQLSWVVLAASVFLPVMVPAQPSAPPRPALVIAISVDQMRADYLTRYQRFYSGGLKWLYENGVVFERAFHNHAVTETAPGHAVILSGLNPGRSGMVANYWYDRDRRAAVYCVEDTAVSILEDAKAEGRSPKNLMGTTLGDWIKEALPRSRVISISGKDRSAILMGGKHADEVYWYSGGKMVTSSYYQRQVARWIGTVNDKRIPLSYFNKTWDYLQPGAEFYKLFGRDDVANEKNWNSTFPHPIGVALFHADSAYYTSFTETPFLDDVVLASVREAVQSLNLGSQENAVDLLTIGLSATDYIGHAYGPGSHEIADQLLRLDRNLGEFFQFIDQRVGLKNTLIALTSDHGALPMPELLAAQGIQSSRLNRDDLMLFRNLDSYLDEKFNAKENWITYYSDHVLYLSYPALGRRNLKRSEVEQAAKEYLSRNPRLAAVYSRTDVESAGSRPGPTLELVRNGFNADRGGDLFLIFAENVYPYVERAGTLLTDHDGATVTFQFMNPFSGSFHHHANAIGTNRMSRNHPSFFLRNLGIYLDVRHHRIRFGLAVGVCRFAHGPRHFAVRGRFNINRTIGIVDINFFSGIESSFFIFFGNRVAADA